MENLENLINTYHELGINHTLDFDKFNHIAIVHHSAAIEGSTLTEVESISTSLSSRRLHKSGEMVWMEFLSA